MTTFANLGAGSVTGAVAEEISAHLSTGDTLLTADRDADRARHLAHELSAEALTIDITDPGQLHTLLGRADVLVNGVGPFHRFGRIVIDACVEAGVHYVDICDEADVTRDILDDDAVDRAAAETGLTVLLGCGASPGLTTIAGEWAAEGWDRVDTLDLYVGVPTMRTFGVTINAHMLHALSGDVLQVFDGDATTTLAWGGRQVMDLPDGFGEHEFGYMGHPEPLSWKRSHPELTRATFRWSWLSPETNDLWQAYAATGMAGDEEVPGTGMSPRQFLARFMDSEQGAQVPGATPRERPHGSAWRIVATGLQDGVATRRIVDHVISYPDLTCAADMLTAYPAARAALGIADGSLSRRGVLTPDQAFTAGEIITDYMARTGTTLERVEVGAGVGQGEGPTT